MTQEEAAVTMGAAAAPGMARTEPARVHRLHYRLTRGVATRVLLSLPLVLCHAAAPLSASTSPFVLFQPSFLSSSVCLSLLLSLSHSSSFSFSLTDSDYLPLLTTLPSPSSSPRLLPLLLLLAYLSFSYGLLFANSAPTIDASRLIANPASTYRTYFPSL